MLAKPLRISIDVHAHEEGLTRSGITPSERDAYRERVDVSHHRGGLPAGAASERNSLEDRQARRRQTHTRQACSNEGFGKAKGLAK